MPPYAEAAMFCCSGLCCAVQRLCISCGFPAHSRLYHYCIFATFSRFASVQMLAYCTDVLFHHA